MAQDHKTFVKLFDVTIGCPMATMLAAIYVFSGIGSFIILYLLGVQIAWEKVPFIIPAFYLPVLLFCFAIEKLSISLRKSKSTSNV
jgi:hypothetical protein